MLVRSLIRAARSAPLLGACAALAPAAHGAPPRPPASPSPEIGASIFHRKFHTATVLANGRVLLAGGAVEGSGAPAQLAEVLDPLTATFVADAPMVTPRHHHAAFSRADGAVVILGGIATSTDQGPLGPSPAPELYRLKPPTSREKGSFSGLGPAPAYPYAKAPAVALRNDRALLFGGPAGAETTSTATHAYVHDLATGAHGEGLALLEPRRCFAAVMLDDGRVLVAGGIGTSGGPLASAELLDLDTRTASRAGDLPSPRAGCLDGEHELGAALLPLGLAVVAPVEKLLAVFDPATSSFALVASDLPSTTAPLLSLPSGRIFAHPYAIAGDAASGFPVVLASAAPQSAADGGTIGPSSTQLVLPSGDVLASGQGADNPASDQLVLSMRAPVTKGIHTEDTLLSPWFVGDAAWAQAPGGPPIARTPTASVFGQSLFRLDTSSGLMRHTSEHPSWGTLESVPLAATPSGDLVTHVSIGPYGFVTTISNDGSPKGLSVTTPALIGATFSPFEQPSPYLGVLRGSSLDDVALVARDPAQGALSFITQPGNLCVVARPWATFLPSTGSSLFAVGGATTSLLAAITVESLDPTAASSDKLPLTLQAPRAGAHALTRLDDGKVLVTGGFPPSTTTFTSVAHAEVIDTKGMTATRVDDLAVARSSHVTRAVGGGAALIAGGESSLGTPLTELSLERFDGDSSFEPIASPFADRSPRGITFLRAGETTMIAYSHFEQTSDTAPRQRLLAYDDTEKRLSPLAEKVGPIARGTAAARLPSGKVLLVGASAQLFDPETGARSALDFPGPARRDATATLLPDGSVLVVGGSSASEPLDDAFVFEKGDASTPPRFVAISPPSTARAAHSATVLAGGRVLLAGGVGAGGQRLASADLFDPATRSFTVAPSLQRPRVGHAAALLPSGDVLLAGGTGPTGAPDGAEVLSLRGQGRIVGARVIDGEARAISLVDGSVLVSTRTGHARFDPQTESFAPLAGDLSARHAGSSALVSSIAGYLTTCSSTACVRVAQGTGAFEVEVPLSAGVDPAPTVCASVRTPRGGALLVFEPAAGEEIPRIFSRTPVPSGAQRPSLSAPAAALVAGQSATLAARRLGRLPARGASALGPRPGLRPLVAFMPESEGGPIYATVTDVRDDVTDGQGKVVTEGSVTFALPPTAHTGPGFLHVIVGGVASDGVFAVLKGLPQAASCDVDVTCESGHCVDGVCCDGPCDDACHACSAAAKSSGPDGVCSPMHVDSTDEACLPDDLEVCGRTGVCGEGGACRVALDDTPCTSGDRTGLCRGGACALVPRCDASSNSSIAPDGTVTACSPYRCEDGACPTSCRDQSDCAGEFACERGACRATCDGNVAVGSGRVDCGPFRCIEGACPSSCTSNLECAQGHGCVDGACRPQSFAAAAPETSACSVARPNAASLAPLALAALALGARRRRARARATTRA